LSVECSKLELVVPRVYIDSLHATKQHQHLKDMHTAERATGVIYSSPEFLTFLVSACACSVPASKRGNSYGRVQLQPTFSLKREQAQFPTQKKN
jgi:hypothetical protein